MTIDMTTSFGIGKKRTADTFSIRFDGDERRLRRFLTDVRKELDRVELLAARISENKKEAPRA